VLPGKIAPRYARHFAGSRCVVRQLLIIQQPQDYAAGGIAVVAAENVALLGRRGGATRPSLGFRSLRLSLRDPEGIEGSGR